MRRRGPSRPEIALLIVSLGVALALGELLLRGIAAWTRPARLADLAASRPLPAPGTAVDLGDLLEPSRFERLVYRLRPDLDVFFSGVRVRTNSDGWRDPETPLAVGPGTARVVGIGDSVMFGWGVAREDRYLTRAARELSSRDPLVAWATATLAVPGYNLVMELEALERFGLPLEPDLIVYGYVANDRCLPNFVTEGAGARLHLLDLLRNVGLPSPALRSRDAAVQPAELGAGFVRRFCRAESVAPPLRPLVGDASFRAALDRLAEIGRALDTPIVVVSHPMRSELPLPDFPSGLLVVDAFGEPGATAPAPPPRRFWVAETDRHPNAEGHAQVARRLIDALIEGGVVDRVHDRVQARRDGA
ncbi:MAG: SGNH/GDSL hydrolase family protein [Acidobacteriota bacterium]